LAVTSVSIGGKIGLVEYNGDFFPGSGDIGTSTGYAIFLGFGAVPVVDFEIRASYFAKDVDLSYEYGGQTLETSFEYQDVGVTALLTKSVFSPAGTPFAVYVGGGVGYHIINTEIATAVMQGGIALDDINDPFAVTQNTGRMSGEGVAGLRLSAPGFPLAAFGEFSYGVIFTQEHLTTTTIAGGIALEF
jgi:hypothetical protein